jgi:hypothetical protein
MKRCVHNHCRTVGGNGIGDIFLVGSLSDWDHVCHVALCMPTTMKCKCPCVLCIVQAARIH